MPETTQFGGMEEDSQLDGALQPNTILLARYQIMGLLGGGGQGAVYQARDLNFPEARRLVAVKEMLVSSSNPKMRAATIKTFQREANILATLSHPAIPKIYDFFDQNNDRAYLVMEYINGSDLEAILHKTKKLPMKKILEWAIDLCDVLDYLHNQPEPIIFRDMKPANVMIDSLGKVRLIDFGIAKIFVSKSGNTQIGTEGYSAPEQYKGNVNPLSDIYSLAATLHHVITRKDPRLEPPFSFAERPVMDFNPDAPPRLNEILDKALQFEQEGRYESLGEMKSDLEEVRYQLENPSARIASTSPATSSTSSGGNGAQHGETDFFQGMDGDDITAGIRAKWEFATEDEIRSSPTYFDKYAFVGSYDTNVWAINLEDGELIWKRPSDGGIASSPVIDPENKQVLYGSEDYTYAAVSMRDGKIKWSYTTGGKIRSTGTVAHGHVFFGSDDGKLYALLTNNGRYMWEYDAGAPIRTKPAVTNDRVIFGTEDGELVGLELSGSRKWAYRTRKAISSSPVVDIENYCYVGGVDGFLYVIDAENGFSILRFRTNGPIFSSPVVMDSNVYFGSADGNFYCVNSVNGKEKWKFETGSPIIASPIVHNGVVYFGGNNNTFYALDASSGTEKWRFETQGAITSTPCVAENVLLISSIDTRLYALPLV